MQPSSSRRDARLIFAPLAAAAIVVTAIILLTGGDGDPATEATTALPDGCESAEAPPPKDVKLERPPLDPPPAGTTATVATNCGDFVITLDTERAPRTTASFAFMAEQGLYDETPFHRVAQNFLIQGGDPKGDGTGGPGYFVDEPPPDDIVYARGVVAMAKSGAEPPGRSGSQFFVVTAPADAGLPPDSALLGRVTKGFDVVERLESLGVPMEDSAPTVPLVIESVTIG